MNEEQPSLESVVVKRVAEHLKLDEHIVASALPLVERNEPLPYLARYKRVEVGGLDERGLRAMLESAHAMRELEKRREFILRALADREGVPNKARKRIHNARTPAELEYVYEPYRAHGRTSASLALEAGHGPLAEAFMKGETPEAADEAIDGAVDIMAHSLATDTEARMSMLRTMEKQGEIRITPGAGRDSLPPRYAKLRNAEGRLSNVQPGTLLALLRAEGEGALHISLEFPEEKVHGLLEQRLGVVRAKPAKAPEPTPEEAEAPAEQAEGEQAEGEQPPAEPEATPAPAPAPEVPVEVEVSPLLANVRERAIALALRLMRMAVTRDALASARTRAQDAAIHAACMTLHDNLLFPPAGQRRVMGVDPAPRGSVPVACVGARGEPLEHAKPRFFGKDEEKIAAGRQTIRDLVATHDIELIALGNGKGRHECEAFLRDCLAEREAGAPPIVVVSEQGIGAYASGPLARRELPSRPGPIVSAIALARRLQDPLVEITKLDPKLVVGGHGVDDIEPRLLNRELRGVAEHCVNLVGVDVNRAPAEMLSYVCGLNRTSAREIVTHREANGPFRLIAQISELGAVSELAFEQAAGFLRIHGGENALDATSVHPRDYPLVERIAESKGVAPGELVGKADLLIDIDAAAFADETYSEAVVDGVVGALLEASVDPRPALEVVATPPGVRTSADLKSGMKLPGRVTNVKSFGAFVDLGVGQDGLVHVSEIADRFVKDPSGVVHVGQLVEVRVLGVDKETGRISLSMRTAPREERGRGGGRGGDRGRGRGGDRGRREGGDRKPARGRGDRRGRPREDRESVPDSVRPMKSPPKKEPMLTVPTEDPVPADMSEEEFMKQKMEELKKRFG